MASLLCANCHGVEGEGGSAPIVLQPELDKCEDEENQKNPDVPECLPKSVQWQAPDLTRHHTEQVRLEVDNVQRGYETAAARNDQCLTAILTSIDREPARLIRDDAQ